MDAAQIEAMNQVRASLGMAPLPVPGVGATHEADASDDDFSTLEKREAAGASNFQRLEKERQDKIEREQRKAQAMKAREMAQRHAKLKGKGLGDEDEEGDQDTRSWLLGQKKRQKEIEKARKMEAELAERLKAEAAEYTSKDLAGALIAHDVADFDDDAEHILTLKDAVIGEDSGEDELESSVLRAKEKLEENLKRKKKRPAYDPTEQNEDQAILSKYDEEIEGKKQKRFALGAQGQAVEETVEAETSGKGIKINLDMLDETKPVSDYLEPTKFKVKKPKKKNIKRREERDDGLETGDLPVAMDVDENAVARKRPLEVDDDDLQDRLAQQRQKTLKKRKKMDAAELARQMRDEMQVDEQNDEEGGVIVDETTEFIAGLRKPELDAERPLHARAASDDKDEEIQDVGIKQETAAAKAGEGPELSTTGLEEETMVGNQGIGAMMSMLRKRGIVGDSDSALQTEKERQRARLKAEMERLAQDYDAKARAQREADRRNGRYARLSNQERDEYNRKQNEARELHLARLEADLYAREYRPDVRLEYYDENGRAMTPKEAFKHLSHKFHGKGSGKKKTDKRLKKIADEQKERNKSIFHTGEGSGLDIGQEREGRKQNQAGVRLQ
ncbi:hypothetical protein K470DRAFT_212529 [Piedraia hortae CBS 480.64]|uniref:SART-1 protein n=1 Tax=Piedraia hortae CBS 480.64 TaxID=1314780 RepID=A0A6A7C5B5_9PEZI|nr:hypothetical protein K470DRAFT_212529 [Piedraia hortae CBS 480.64]